MNEFLTAVIAGILLRVANALIGGWVLMLAAPFVGLHFGYLAGVVVFFALAFIPDASIQVGQKR